MVIKIFRHHWQLYCAILALGDLLLGFGAFLAANAVLLAPADVSSAVVPFAILFASLMNICVAAMGLYGARQRSAILGLVMRLLVAVVLGLLSNVLMALPFLPVAQNISIRQLMLASLFLFLLAIVFHFVMDRLASEEWLKRKILVYGAGKRASSLMRLRRRSDRRGFSLVGFVAADGDEPAEEISLHLLNKEESLRQHCRLYGVHEIVVAMDDRRRGFPMNELFDCRLDGIEVTELVSFLERETGKLHLDVLNPSWMIFSSGFKRGRIHEYLERSLDLLFSLMLTLIGMPVMILTAIAIKIEDGAKASVFYRQKRVGQYGCVFSILKFRSMSEDAEHDGKPQWAKADDSRVTRVGKFIRALRIDELPQMLNVLGGQMSFVGPRPERPEFVGMLTEKIPYYQERHSIRPGITGWAQLCYPYGSSERDAVEKLQYDLYYVKNHGPLFYLAILLQTVEVILWRKGAR